LLAADDVPDDEYSEQPTTSSAQPPVQSTAESDDEEYYDLSIITSAVPGASVPPVVVAQSDSQLYSNFPRVSRVETNTYLSYTDAETYFLPIIRGNTENASVTSTEDIYLAALRETVYDVVADQDVVQLYREICYLSILH